MENNNNLKTMAERALAFIHKRELIWLWPHDTQDIAIAICEFVEMELSLSSPLVPEVVEWEYKRMVGPYSADELNDWGTRGWELCSSYWENNFLYQIFKRKKQKQ